MPSAGPEPNVRGLTKGLFVEAGFTIYTRGFVRFFEALPKCIQMVECSGAWSPGERTDGAGPGRTGHLKYTWETWQSHSLTSSLKRFKDEAHARHKKGRKVIFIGNGGSAAIASHMAVDWTKNGPIRAIAFNDAPTLTCLANDHGYQNVFAKQLEFYAQKDDLVVIISSSGRSQNILAAARAANTLGLDSVRLAGMDPENELLRGGRLRFYVPSDDYGLVELTHLCLLHSIVSVVR